MLPFVLCIVIALCMSVTGCVSNANSTSALCTITTSTSEVATILTTQTFEKAHYDAIYFFSEEEESISITFTCPACGVSELYESTTATPTSLLLECDCGSEFWDTFSGNKPEYAYVVWGTGYYFFGSRYFEETNVE